MSYCGLQVNDYLNNPPAAGSSGSGRSSAGGALAAAASGIPGLDMSNLRDSELHSLLNHMSQQQLMQLFGDAGQSVQPSPPIESDLRPDFETLKWHLKVGLNFSLY